MKKLFFASTFLFLSAVFAESETANRRPVPGTQQMNATGYDQGHEVKKTQMMPGYNAPSRYDVKGCWDIYLNGTFIYWQPLEGGLSFAATTPSPFSPVRLPIFDLDTEEISSNFKPGFKVGMGLNSSFDNWDIYLEYTWFHFTQSSSATLPPGGQLFILPWFDGGNTAGNADVSFASARWKFSLDLLDFELGRFYYVGTNLSFRPHIGARAAWIDQKFDVTATFPDVNNRTGTSRNKSDTWALGPRAGIDTNWLLGLGFRTFGNIATSLLYTRYKLNLEEDTINTALITTPIAISFATKYHILCPNLELGLGFGWGTYFADCTWHFDLAASYDFHIFWNQNYLRPLTDSKINGFSFKPDDLYMHGLTLRAQFDF